MLWLRIKKAAKGFSYFGFVGAPFLILFLTVWFSSVRAQTSADSIRISRALFRAVQCELAEWDSLSRTIEHVRLPDTTTIVISKRQFNATYPDVISNLLRYQAFRTKRLVRLTRNIQSLIKIHRPDSTFSECSLYRLPVDSCLVVPKVLWEQSISKLKKLEFILSASTKDSTLIFQTSGKAIVSENFFGSPSVNITGKVIFLSPKRDTLYTLLIRRLKIPAVYKRSIWAFHLTAVLTINISADKSGNRASWAIGVSSVNYRRFFLTAFLGTKGAGAALGWRLFEHAGPALGIKQSFSGIPAPVLGFAFLLN